jgi:hypothetical protein
LQPLWDRLQRRKAVARFYRMDSCAIAVAMIDSREDPHQAIAHSPDAYTVGSLRLVRGVDRDSPVMGIHLALRPGIWREQPVLAHQSQHALTRGPYASQDAKAFPYLDALRQ